MVIFIREKSNMRILFIFLVLLFFSPLAFSQDVHLTQYYTSNLSLNPAFTGNYDGDVRMVANSRSQWGQVSSPIRTNMVSIEKKIDRYPDEFGLGLIFINDQVSAYYLKTNKILLSGSFQKNIRKNLIRIGVQGGMVFRTIDLGGQTFPDQWNYQLGSFDQSLPTGQANLQNSRTYPVINAGAGWTRRFGKTKLSAGYGLFNINHPDDGFIHGGKGLPIRHVLNGSATYHISKQLSLTPQLLYMRTAKATDFIIGANASQKVKEDLSLLLGGGYRGSTINSDAVMVIAGGTYKRFQMGFSMDFNVSDLSKYAKNKTAWEISLTYTTPSRIPGKMTIPCDRY
jgi:type IX secretion system PorP/SprF family membrane protein